MGLFDNIANLVEDNISDVAMGYIGQMNLLHAEGRVADTEKAKDAATAAAANKKAMWSKYFELTKTDVGKETIAGTGWLEANYTNLLDTGLLETMIGIVHDIDASKMSFGNFKDPNMASIKFPEDKSDTALTAYKRTLANIEKEYKKDPLVFEHMASHQGEEFNKLSDYMATLLTNFSSELGLKGVKSSKSGFAEFVYVPNLGAFADSLSKDKTLVKALKERNIDFTNAHAEKIQRIAVADILDVPEENVITLKGPRQPNGDTPTLALPLSPKSLASLKNYALYAGKDVQEVIDNFWYVNQDAWEDIDWKDEGASNDAIRKYYHPLVVAMKKLGNLNLEALDPGNNLDDSLFFRSGNGAKAIEEMVKAGMVMNYMVQPSGIDTEKRMIVTHDSQAMRAALVPFMNFGLQNADIALGRGWTTKSVTEREYFQSRTQYDAKDFNMFTKGAEASAKSVQTLLRLQQITGKVQTVGAAGKLVSGFLGFFKKGSIDEGTFKSGGFVSQLANSYENDVDAGLLQTLQTNLNDAYKTDVALGEAEALRIVAAFEMARAFDPAGRLSNMDVEMQLARLGGAGFKTVAQVQAQIQVAIMDLREKQKYYEIFDASKYSSQGVMTAGQQAAIDATMALMRIEKDYINSQYAKGLVQHADGQWKSIVGIGAGSGGSEITMNNNEENNEIIEEAGEAFMVLKSDDGNPDNDIPIVKGQPILPNSTNGISVSVQDNTLLTFTYTDPTTGSPVVEPVLVPDPNNPGSPPVPATKGIHWVLGQDSNGTPAIVFK